MRYVESFFTNIQEQHNMLKISIYFLRNLQDSQINNSRIRKIKNVKFSGYCFYMYTNIYRDFQICISVPLNATFSLLLFAALPTAIMFATDMVPLANIYIHTYKHII